MTTTKIFSTKTKKYINIVKKNKVKKRKTMI